MVLERIIMGEGEFVRPGTSYGRKAIAPWIECKDGTRLSVQCSQMHYCTPRTDYGPYYEVEVGYPTAEPPESWAPYFDGDWETDDHTGTVYGYVPIELVREYVEAHGGEV